MNEEYVNAYIERLGTEVDNLNRNRILLETQIKMFEKANIEMVEKIKRLEADAIPKAQLKKIKSTEE